MDERPKEALYRKWRSRSFDDLVGQEPVVRTLRNAVASGRVAHAYLFAGPRGTGKTSLARILAKAINCLLPETERPCDRCDACRAIAEGRAVDVIEIDAASNRGVDDIRSLRDKVNFRPVELRNKVYIIDEAHQLTREAFNALLKTLEEPPPNTLFVLATTQPQDVPATIVSRCQRFEFHRIPTAVIVSRLRQVAEAEGILVEEAAIESLARSARGSLRDALSLLDQVASSGISPVTLEDVRLLLGQVSGDTVAGILTDLGQGNLNAALSGLRRAVYEGADVRQLCIEILEGLRQAFVVAISGDPEGGTFDAQAARRIAQAMDVVALQRAIRAFSRAESALRFRTDDALPLELAAIEIVVPEPIDQGASSVPRVDGEQLSTGEGKVVSMPTTVHSRSQPVFRPQTAQPSTREGRAQPSTEGEVEVIASDPQAQALARQWARVLEDMRPTDRRLEALLKSCQPLRVDGDLVTLGFYYEFHQRKVDEPQNRVLVERVLSRVMGRSVKVKTVLAPRRNSKVRPIRPQELVEKDELVRAAINLFNAKIVSIDPE